MYRIKRFISKFTKFFKKEKPPVQPDVVVSTEPVEPAKPDPQIQPEPQVAVTVVPADPTSQDETPNRVVTQEPVVFAPPVDPEAQARVIELEYLKRINAVSDVLPPRNAPVFSFDAKTGKRPKPVLCSLDEFGEFLKGKKIAVVANSSDLLRHKLGEFIDMHDVVIRFNSFSIIPAHTGSRTDIHAMIWLQEWNLDVPVKYRLVYSGNTPNWKRTVEDKLEANWQEYVVNVPYPQKDKTYGFKYQKGMPTTGFNTIKMIHNIGGYESMRLFGFTFYESGTQSILRTTGAEAHPISNMHNYEYEKVWLMENSIEFDPALNIIKL